MKTYPLSSRKSKVDEKQFAKPLKPGAKVAGFIDSLPDVLAAKDFKALVSRIVKARSKRKQVVMAFGAHVIKVGLSPLIIDLMERGVVTAIAMNGACIVHDFEIALMGKTSEDVDEALEDGSFGFADETLSMINGFISDGVDEGKGIGRAVGESILNGKKFKNRKKSILAEAARLGVPATVHVGIGTDIVHMSPMASGAAIGEGSMRDFREFASIIAKLEGGVYLNIGSAVLLPEVFLKALSIARNLGNKVEKFTTVNMDFIRSYRTAANVLKRPTSLGGDAIELIGHHEIMLPLLVAAVIDALPKTGKGSGR